MSFASKTDKNKNFQSIIQELVEYLQKIQGVLAKYLEKDLDNIMHGDEMNGNKPEAFDESPAQQSDEWETTKNSEAIIGVGKFIAKENKHGAERPKI